MEKSGIKFHAFFVLKILLLGIVNTSFSQDSLALITGKSLAGELSYEDQQFLYFNKKVADDKIKMIRYPLRLIYSLTNKLNETKVYYKQDKTNGNNLSENQMKMFVLGEQDAFKRFNGKFHFLLGIGFGLTSSLIDTYEFKNATCKGYFNDSPSVISIVTPFLSSVIIGFPNRRVRKIYASELDYLSNNFYRRGFNRVKNYRKTSSAFLGGLSSVVTVLVTTFIHQKNNSCP